MATGEIRDMNTLDEQIKELEDKLAALKKTRGVFVGLFHDGEETEYEGYERVRIDNVSFLLDRDMSFRTEDEIEFPENESEMVIVNQLGLIIDNELKYLVPVETGPINYYDYPKYILRIPHRES